MERLQYLDNFCAFFLGDEAVVVNVVHVERPLESLLGSPSRCGTQGRHKLPEVQSVVSVSVEGSEHVLSKLLRTGNLLHNRQEVTTC